MLMLQEQEKPLSKMLTALWVANVTAGESPCLKHKQQGYLYTP